MTDPGIAGAATTFVVLVVLGLVGWLIERRQRRLERIEQRKVWRRDWLVGVDCPYGETSPGLHHPIVVGVDFADTANMVAMSRDEHGVVHALEGAR